jgi:hypothetical protein
VSETLPEPPRRPTRTVGYLAGWFVAAVLAVVIGLIAVSSVGASIRGRGPLGDNEAIRQAELNRDTAVSPQPDDEPQQQEITDEFGGFLVECRGVAAYGIEARPDEAAGWRVVSFERGPDDDVDAVFANQGRSIDVEVFCNRGVPTVAEIERHELPDDD